MWWDQHNFYHFNLFGYCMKWFMQVEMGIFIEAKETNKNVFDTLIISNL